MTSTLSPMTPQRRTAIREVLVAQASAETSRSPLVPGAARSRRPLAIVGSLAAAVAVTAAVIVVGDPTAPAGYASWSAVPETAPGSPVSNDDLEQWGSRCSDLGVGGVAIEGVPRRADQAAQRQPLIDRRGDFTFCVDVSPGNGTEAEPLIALSGIRADRGLEDLNTMWATVVDEPYRPPSAGEVLVLTGDLGPGPDEVHEEGVTSLEVYQLAGVAGPDVEGVDIVLTNGLRVTATVEDGIWGAWWPAAEGDPSGSRLHVRTSTGTHVIDPRTVVIL